MENSSIVIYILSSALGTWAMAVNKNFEATSRIPKNRYQLVCSTGPYKFIRHPGYLAVVLWSMSVPFIFGSMYTIIPSSSVLIIMFCYS